MHCACCRPYLWGSAALEDLKAKQRQEGGHAAPSTMSASGELESGLHSFLSAIDANRMLFTALDYPRTSHLIPPPNDFVSSFSVITRNFMWFYYSKFNSY